MHKNIKFFVKDFLRQCAQSRSFLRKEFALCEEFPYSEFFWSECGKIRTRKTPNTNTFYTVLFTFGNFFIAHKESLKEKFIFVRSVLQSLVNPVQEITQSTQKNLPFRNIFRKSEHKHR